MIKKITEDGLVYYEHGLKIMEGVLDTERPLIVFSGVISGAQLLELEQLQGSFKIKDCLICSDEELARRLEQED